MSVCEREREGGREREREREREMETESMREGTDLRRLLPSSN